MKIFWDERYSHPEFAYGTEPNAYLKEKLPEFKPGKILFPAEGEGRNAVFAAQLGWQVSAFDFSTKGKEKAEQLARAKQVSIDYKISNILEEKYADESFDAVCLTYVHFPSDVRLKMHQRLNNYLKIGGHLIFEVFSKDHREINKANPAAGGPPNENMMYSLNEIHTAYRNFDFIELKKELISLHEGIGHNGQASVIRFIGKKIN